MSRDELEQIIIQLRRAVEILEADEVPVTTKINALETIGSICTYKGRIWGDAVYDRACEQVHKANEQKKLVDILSK